MRILSVSAVLALLLTASSAFAQDPPPKADSATPAPKKKKAAKGKKKKAPESPKEEVAASEPAPAPVAPPPAPAPAPAPAVVTQPAPEPVAQTSTTSATIGSPSDRDRGKKQYDEVAPFSVAPLVGIATNDLYGIGVGVRAGYTLPMKLYIGGQFMYHLGPSLGGDASAPAYYPSLEIGYDLHPANHLVVRPYGGGGVVFNHFSAGSLSGTSKSAMIYPGCVVTYTFPGSPVFVGGDFRWMFSPGSESRGNALALFASAGLQF